jgi:hypothetical protein
LTEEDNEQVFPYPVGFAATLRIAFDHFRNRFSTLAALFCGVHLFLTLLPFVFFFDIPDSTQLSLFLFLQILLPVSFGSVAVAIGTAIVANDIVGRDDVGPGAVWRSFGVVRRDSFMAALVAAIVRPARARRAGRERPMLLLRARRMTGSRNRSFFTPRWSRSGGPKPGSTPLAGSRSPIVCRPEPDRVAFWQ